MDGKMTNAEKKDILLRYGFIERKISRLLEERRRWEDRALSLSRSFSDMPRGKSPDTISKSVCQIIELEQEIDRVIDETVELRRQIESAIAGLQDEKLCELLRYRYIEGMTWERVSEAMHMDVRWVLRLHRRALEKLTIESHYSPAL